MIEKESLVLAPPFIRKNFNFAVSFKPSLIHPFADLSNFNAAFTHETAVVEKIDRRGFPIADVKCIETFCLPRALDLLLQYGIPPDVKKINSNPELLW